MACTLADRNRPVNLACAAHHARSRTRSIGGGILRNFGRGRGPRRREHLHNCPSVELALANSWDLGAFAWRCRIREGPGATVVLNSFQELLLALVLLLPVSFLLGGTYLALIAAEVQQRALPWEILLPRVLRLAKRLGGLVGIMLVVTVVPFAVASLMLSLIPLIGGLLLLLAVALLLWVAFYVFFIVDSIALVRQTLPKVIRLTLDVIHANLWSSIGFFFLYWLIVFGTGILWSPILSWEILSISVGRIIATIGNAYVGTWVTIALFMYVWNRLLIHRGEPSSV